MSLLSTDAIPQELQRDGVVTLWQLTTGITNLAVRAFHRLVDAPRVLAVFEQLLEVIHQAR